MGMGTADLSYPKKEFHPTFEDWGSIEDFDKPSYLNWDMFGIYFHTNSQLLIGANLAATAVRYENESNFAQLNIYNLALSAIYYFDDNHFGEGFFLRSDFGISSYAIVTKNVTSSSGEPGNGYLVAAGFSFDLTQYRILIYYSLSAHSIQKEDYSSSSLSFGFLF